MRRPAITESAVPARALLSLAWALGLLLLPSLACAGPPAESAQPMQGDLISRLPADAIAIGFVDFVALRQSPVYDFFRSETSELDGSREFQEFVNDAGMDPRTDLHRVAFASRRVTEQGPRGSVVIAVASFDRQRLEGSLEDHPSTTYAGHTLWALEGDNGREAEAEDDNEPADAVKGYVVILDNDTAAFGDRAMLEGILDVGAGAASARTNERLMKLVEDVDPDSEIWAVSDQDRLLSDLAPEHGDSQIPVDKIQSLILSVQLSTGVALELRGRTAAQEDAQLLGDSLNGMLAFGKMMLQRNSPEIFAILDESVSAGSSGRDVTVRADLSMEDIQALRDFARTTLEDTFKSKQEGASGSGPGE